MRQGLQQRRLRLGRPGLLGRQGAGQRRHHPRQLPDCLVHCQGALREKEPPDHGPRLQFCHLFRRRIEGQGVDVHAL